MNVSFSADQFSNFMAILRILKYSCLSVSIVEGKIIQTSTDRGVLYNIDLTSIVGNSTIMFDNLGFKFDLLDILSRQNSKIDFSTSEKEYKFFDKTSTVTYRIPEKDCLKVKPISEDSRTFQTLSSISNNKIFSCEFTQNILERIMVAKKALDAEKMIVTLDEDVARFTITLNDNIFTSHMTILEVDNLNVNTFKGLLNFPLSPFLIKSELIKCEIGVNEISPERMTLKLSMNINKIPIEMYTTQIFKQTISKKLK